MENIYKQLINIYEKNFNDMLRFMLLMSIAIVLALLFFFITKGLEKKYVQALIRKSKTKWDDYLVDRGFFKNAILLVPVLVFQGVLKHSIVYKLFFDKFIKILIVLIVVMIINSFLNVLDDIYKNYKISKEHPIKSYLQVISLVVIIFAVVISIGILFDKSPLTLLSGLGAMTAIIMLIFKDAILGFVASIQLIANRMVAIGDWIEMPSQNADGDVIEINLTNVKVENWDRTISTIPSYALVSNSFRNWKGMTKSGARRIKRSIFIDFSSVHFLSDDEIIKFGKMNLLKEYIKNKQKEIEEYNKDVNIEDSIVNGRKLTNLGTFRAYIFNYLKNSKNIDQDKTILVRQLQPTPEGIPLEIYCFANTTVWGAYESIQSDLFDYFIAVAPEFSIDLFQKPSSKDIRTYTNRLN